MAQLDRIGTRSTIVRHSGNTGEVQYHNTVVVQFTDKFIWLKHGGWMTQTTRNRMNQASNQFGLGFRVFQKDFEWFVTYQGKTIPFTGEVITLSRV